MTAEQPTPEAQDEVLEETSLISHLVELRSRLFKMVGAVYDMHTGKVSMLNH